MLSFLLLMLVTRQVSPSSVPQTVREVLAAFVVLPGRLAFSKLGFPARKETGRNQLAQPRSGETVIDVGFCPTCCS